MPRYLILVLLCASTIAQARADDPKSAAREVLDALAGRDAERLLRVVYINDEDQRPLAKATVDVLIGGRTFADAATKRFGPAADAIAAGPITPADVADLDGATVDIVDNTADVYLKGQVIPMKFIRDGSSWKLSISHYHGSGKDERTPADRAKTIRRQVALLQMTTSALNETAAEIEADKYATPADVEAAIKQKLNFVLMRNLEASTRPS